MPFERDQHPHVAARAEQGPVKVADQHATGSAVARFNARLAAAITRGVGTMWCAYAFAGLDLFSLPAAIHNGLPTIITWVAQTFLQLTLLSVIMVGQNIAALAADARSEATWRDAEAILHEVGEIHRHIDELPNQIVAAMNQGGRP